MKERMIRWEIIIMVIFWCGIVKNVLVFMESFVEIYEYFFLNL